MSNGIKDLLQRVKDAPRPTQQVQTMRLVPRAPLFLRQFAGDLTGNFLRDKLGLETLGNLVGSRDIDENTLGSSEYRALQQAAVKTLGRETSNVAPDTWQLNYDDYGLDDLKSAAANLLSGGAARHLEGEEAEARKEYEDQLRAEGWNDDDIADLYAQSWLQRTSSHKKLREAQGGQGIVGALLSSPPSFSVAATFGGGRLSRDPDTGEYFFEDEYDFNDGRVLEEGSGWQEYIDDINLEPHPFPLRGGTPAAVYARARVLGKHYASKPGEGSSTRINLGDLDHLLNPEEDKPGFLTRGLVALGNLLKRDREPTPVLAEQIQADGTSVPSELDLLKEKLAEQEKEYGSTDLNMSELDIRKSNAEALLPDIVKALNFDR